MITSFGVLLVTYGDPTLLAMKASRYEDLLFLGHREGVEESEDPQPWEPSLQYILSSKGK